MPYDQSSGNEQYRFSRPSFFRGFSFFPPVIKGLFISNIAMWLLVDFFLGSFRIGGAPVGGGSGSVTRLLALYPIGPDFWPWQLFTYMFLHGGFMHLFFNMLALWMFGMQLENKWGSKKFLIYYLLCGVGAGVANLFVSSLLGQGLPTVGASGAVFGVLIAFGMLFPNMPVYIYFLLPIPAKYFIAGYIALELFYGVAGTSDGIAHFAHLGGAAVGFIYMVLTEKDLLVGSWFSRLRGEIHNPFSRSDRIVWKDGRSVEVHDARFYDIRTGKPRDDRNEGVTQEVIDAILDKISKGGYQSLSEDEKRILNEASRKIH